MEWIKEVLGIFVSIVLIPCITIICTILSKWLKTKLNSVQSKLTEDEIEELVTIAVHTVCQNFVEDLKKKQEFTKEKQIEAQNMAKNLIYQGISEKNKKYIEEHFYDLDLYIEQKIESCIHKEK